MVRSMVPTVIRKEFREYRRNRFIVFTMAAMPVVVLLILVGETFALPERIPLAALRRPVGEALLFLQLIPVMLPTTIAAYAVIGEREQGTLEPVLTTPVTDRALLAGKAIAAALASLPVIGLVALVTFRVIRPSAALYAAAAGAVGLMAAGCWRLATGLFNRERLLTRFGS